MTFQDWKVTFINFMTFQVFHELYEPWPLSWTTLNINGGKTKQLRSEVTWQLNFRLPGTNLIYLVNQHMAYFFPVRKNN